MVMGSWYNGRYRPSRARRSSGLGGAFIELFAVAIMTAIIGIISLFKRK
jgi:hypothetical protein